MFFKNKLLFSLFLTIILAVFLCFLFYAGFLSNIESNLSDRLYSEKSLSDKITIVAIDDRSLQQIGRWPWDRTNFSEAVDAINKKGAKIIGIDVSFFEKSDKDGIVENVFNKYENIVLVSEIGFKPVFSSDYGYANVFADRDGIVRSLPIENSFSAKIAQKVGLEMPNESKTLINYFGKPGTFKIVSFIDIDKTDFKDKIVLIGATAPSLKDTFITPIYQTKEMSGVEIHANIIEMLLTKRFLKHQDSLSIAIIIFIFGIATFLVMHKLRIIYGTAVLVALTISYLYFTVTQFDSGTIMNILYPILAIIVCYVGNVLIMYFIERKEKNFITNIFGKYVSKEVASEILKNAENEGLKLKGEKREITILFSDIRSFTTISEKLSPEELVSFLNNYLTEMANVIMSKRGIVDKYIGDAIMAFWGAPIKEKNHAELACEAALGMIKKLNETKIEFKIGIGLNTGTAIVGNMGSVERVNYTAIGDAVNTASRFEGLTKEYGVEIVIGAGTHELVKDKFVCRELDLIKVKGKNVPTKIFELIGRKENVSNSKIEQIKQFEDGLKYYRKGEWNDAIKEFEKLDDKTSKMFVERCRMLHEANPKDWDGVFTMKTK